MDLFNLLVIGVVIASNNLSVAFTLGALNQKKHIWRIILIFGIFEFLIPLIGAIIGTMMIAFVEKYAPLIGGLLLVGLGIFTLYNTFFNSDRKSKVLVKKVSSWKGLMLLSIGLSLDNMIVGVGLGINEQSPLTLATVISVCSMVFAWIGINIGHLLKQQGAKMTEIISGLLLISLGILTFLEVF